MEKIKESNYKDLSDKCVCLIKDLFSLYIINSNDFFLKSNFELIKNFKIVAEIKAVLLNKENFNILQDLLYDKVKVDECQEYNKLLEKYNKIVYDESIIEIKDITNKSDKVSKKYYEVDKILYFLKTNLTKFEDYFFLELGCGKSHFYNYLNTSNYKINYIGVDMKEDLISNTVKDSNLLVYNQFINYKNFDNFYENKIKIDMKNNFKNISKEGILFGLHTCGNLSSDAIKVFVKSNTLDFKILIIIGCCYNLLKEYITLNQSNSNNFLSYHQSLGKSNLNENLDSTLLFENNFADVGYPISKHILNHSESLFLGRVLRNAAMQSFDIFEDINLIVKKFKILIFRSLFQKLLELNIPELSNIYGFGKLKKKENIENFKQYCYLLTDNIMKQKDKFGLSDEIIIKLKEVMNNKEIDEFMKIYLTEENMKYFVSFYFIRIKFAKIIELLINFDRVIYLEEEGSKNVKLYKIFNSENSNRNYLIYAEKH